MPVTYNDLNTSIIAALEVLRVGSPSTSKDLTTEFMDAIPGYRTEVDALANPEGDNVLRDLNTTILVAILTP